MKYEKYVDKNRGYKTEERELLRTLQEYDWHTCNNTYIEKRKSQSIIMNLDESLKERWNRMLIPLQSTCNACSMCELGLNRAERDEEVRDPHVFSNMNASKIMVVGQNPGWEEVKQRMPFVGISGKNFDTEINKNGITRDDLYICNTVRCFTAGNEKPTEHHKSRCEPFLKMEISLMKPKLVVTLGSVAFNQFCPKVKYSDSLAKISKSERYDVNVFAVYHPSPLNINDPERRKEFNRQIELMCALIKRL